MFTQVQNVRTVMMNQSGQHMVSYGSTSSGAVTPGAAGDEVRVDCCFMTGDGTSVVTGSSLGPPQVWDMQVGPKVGFFVWRSGNVPSSTRYVLGHIPAVVDEKRRHKSDHVEFLLLRDFRDMLISPIQSAI